MGEKVAFLSILRERFPVVLHVWTIEVLSCEIVFPQPVRSECNKDVTEGTTDGATTARRVLFHGDRS